jgi:hypothetical protein
MRPLLASIAMTRRAEGWSARAYAFVKKLQ